MTNILLYAAVVMVWGTTWIAIKYQLGVVPPEFSVAYRFALAAGMIFLWAGVRRVPLRYGLRQHSWFALLGVLIFSTNFVLFYFAAASLTSGLLAVIFSMTVVLNITNATLFLGVRPSLRTLLGAACGVIGMALVFWPEVAAFSLQNEAAVAVLLGLGGTLSFSLGNIVSARIQKNGLPILPATGYGMAYGSVLMFLTAFAQGLEPNFDHSGAYLLSLLYLAVFGSVVAFGCYLVLLGRIGPGPAGYATVLFPIVALAISTVFEDFVWTGASLSGVALVLIGNALVLRRTGTGQAVAAVREGEA